MQPLQDEPKEYQQHKTDRLENLKKLKELYEHGNKQTASKRLFLVGTVFIATPSLVERDDWAGREGLKQTPHTRC